MQRKSFKVECPKCHVTIRVPFVSELKAKAEKEYDLAEISAQSELTNLLVWLNSVSLFTLIKFWLNREQKMNRGNVK